VIALTEAQVVDIVIRIIEANPITVIYQEFDTQGRIVDSFKTDKVSLAGTLRIPPQMLEMKKGNKRFVIGSALGDPMIKAGG